MSWEIKLKKYLLESIKTISISITISIEYVTWTPLINICQKLKPIRAWLWIVYKITENNYRSGLSVSSFKLKRGYLLWKNKYFNWKTICHITSKNVLWTKTERTLCKISDICHCGFKVITVWDLTLSEKVFKPQSLDNFLKKAKKRCDENSFKIKVKHLK